MGRSVSPLLRRELSNLEKDSNSRRSAMKVLRSYVKDLDSKAIPRFLAQVSESKAPSTPSGECTISLYEVLARVHGRNIVPQIDNIMSTIIRTLSSSSGFSPLHQACSKVVPAIARYGIDPSTPVIEKTRIIRCLSEPLCGTLMGPHEGAASGAALCLKALVESDNWKFASSETVNEVCLKAAGALEEKATQTKHHMYLVVALVKHNGLIVEAYARSLVRSGIRILTAGIAESNSQKRLSAIQMIDCLIKRVDTRSISSELSAVIGAIEKCESDEMPFVRNAALETMEAAKLLSTRNGSKHWDSPYPNTGLSFETDVGKWGGSDNDCTAEFASPESQTIDSLFGHENFVDSPVSVGQPSFKFDYPLRTNRRLWGNEVSGVDVSLKDGLFLRAHDDNDNFELRKSDELTDGHEDHSEQFDGFVQSCGSNDGVGRSTTPSPQSSRTTLIADDVKIYTTPRKLIRSLQDQNDASSRMVAGPFPEKTNKSPLIKLNGDDYSCNLQHRVIRKGSVEHMKILGNQKDAEEVQLTTYGDESVSSTSDIVDNEKGVTVETGEKGVSYGRATVGFLCGICFVLLATILSAMRIGDDELFVNIVPT